MAARTVDLDVFVVNVNELSLDIEYDGAPANIPVSQIVTDEDIENSAGSEISITIPEWLAIDRGLI